MIGFDDFRQRDAYHQRHRVLLVQQALEAIGFRVRSAGGWGRMIVHLDNRSRRSDDQ